MLTEPCIKVNEALTGTAVTAGPGNALEMTADLAVISKFAWRVLHPGDGVIYSVALAEKRKACQVLNLSLILGFSDQGIGSVIVDMTT